MNLVHSSWQSWCNWVRFVGLLARTHYFSSTHTFSIGLRSGLCDDGHSNTLTLLSLSHFSTTLQICLGSLSIWKTHLRPSFNFLTDVLMLLQYMLIIFLPHDAIYFVKCTTTWCCHPRASRLGWCSSACKPLLFPPNITMVIMAKQFNFCFIRPEDISPKSTIFPHVQLQTIVWLFLWRFWSSGFFLAKRPFRLCRYRTCFIVDIDTFVPFTPASSQGPSLLFWDWFALFAPKYVHL